MAHDLNTFMGLVPPCPCRRQEFNPVEERESMKVERGAMDGYNQNVYIHK